MIAWKPRKPHESGTTPLPEPAMNQSPAAVCTMIRAATTRMVTSRQFTPDLGCDASLAASAATGSAIGPPRPRS